MKRVGVAIAVLATTALTGCAGAYGGYGYPGFGVAPDDQVGMVQADSACDFGRGADDPGSSCYVTRRPFNYVEASTSNWRRRAGSPARRMQAARCDLSPLPGSWFALKKSAPK